jgi:hypothetical protein
MISNWTISIADVAIILATLLGPILAIQAQKYLERGRELKRRRVDLFRTLMATRATPTSPIHVEALNTVPIDFYGSSSKLKLISSKWKLYRNHLNKDYSSPGWNEEKVRLFVDLLHEMAAYLGYEFNAVEIENEAYIPLAHSTMEADQEAIRKGLAQLLSGGFTIPIELRNIPISPEAQLEQEELRRLLLRWLNGDSSVDVKFTENKPLDS